MGYRFNVGGVLIGSLLALLAGPVSADSFVQQWGSCRQGCDIIADQCHMLSGAEVCDGSRLACLSDCDIAYPTMNVCVNYCEIRLDYCAEASPHASPACGRDNRTCLAGCEGRVAARLP